MKNYYKLSLALTGVAILVGAVLGLQQPLVMLLLALLLGLAFSIYKLNQSAQERFNFYEQIIDAIPNPLSVTDMDMKWTFVNRAATDPLGVTRADVLGQHCSNWGANICNTEDCGVTCLRKGKTVTNFNQWDKDFRVDTHYIHGLNGEKIGHVEIVQEVSEKIALKGVYGDLEAVSENLTMGASNLSDASHALTVGSTQQAASITEIGSSVNEILAQASDNAERATQAASASTNAQDAANNVATEMQELEGAMMEINQSSDKIGEIIEMIDDIASQTNLLALNASIEAARAGEMGRGFAVVADEVRNLAARSTNAASESAQYIQAATENIQRGNEISQRCTSSLQQIVEQSAQISTIIEEMDAASQSQAEGLNQINQAMSEIDEAVNSSATSAEETSNAASELSNLAHTLDTQLDNMRKIEGLLGGDEGKGKGNKIDVVNID